ncbi:MAG: hypothetical protein HC905_25875 [Bacteroidales bacterium]|nr:hypothetical protein [Bacteroidales bacterium]
MMGGDFMPNFVESAVKNGFSSISSNVLTSFTNNWIGDYSGVIGSGFKNSMFEIGHSVIKGGSQGLAGGAILGIINEDVNYLWKGASLGATVGAGMATLRITLMGPTFIPNPEIYCELEDFGQTYRRGSIFTPKGAGITLGRNVVTKLTGDTDYDRYILHHETGHLSQINRLGSFKFYSRTASEYAKHYTKAFGLGIRPVYQTPGTLEFEANKYAFDKLGYYYNIFGELFYKWVF